MKCGAIPVKEDSASIALCDGHLHLVGKVGKVRILGGAGKAESLLINAGVYDPLKAQPPPPWAWLPPSRCQC